MTPPSAEWQGEVQKGAAIKARLRGEFRWSPEIAGKKHSTAGRVTLVSEGKREVLYSWNSPPQSVVEFEVALAPALADVNGPYRIRWEYTGGSSGVCIVRSEVDA